MKTKEELNALKEEGEPLNKKLYELTENDLKDVSGGLDEDKLERVRAKAYQLARYHYVDASQYREIIRHAKRLDTVHYHSWADDIAPEYGFPAKYLWPDKNPIPPRYPDVI